MKAIHLAVAMLATAIGALAGPPTEAEAGGYRANFRQRSNFSLRNVERSCDAGYVQQIQQIQVPSYDVSRVQIRVDDAGYNQNYVEQIQTPVVQQYTAPVQQQVVERVVERVCDCPQQVQQVQQYTAPQQVQAYTAPQPVVQQYVAPPVQQVVQAYTAPSIQYVSAPAVQRVVLRNEVAPSYTIAAFSQPQIQYVQRQRSNFVLRNTASYGHANVLQLNTGGYGHGGAVLQLNTGGRGGRQGFFSRFRNRRQESQQVRAAIRVNNNVARLQAGY